MHDQITATAEWLPADRPGQLDALLALLFNRERAHDAQDVAA
ncbi:hypothetical protein [Cellulomonas sp. P5_C5]